MIWYILFMRSLYIWHWLVRLLIWSCIQYYHDPHHWHDHSQSWWSSSSSLSSLSSSSLSSSSSSLSSLSSSSLLSSSSSSSSSSSLSLYRYCYQRKLPSRLHIITPSKYMIGNLLSALSWWLSLLSPQYLSLSPYNIFFIRITTIILVILILIIHIITTSIYQSINLSINLSVFRW